MTPLIPIERFAIFATGLDHPECLAFDRDGFLYAGGEAGQIYRIDSSGAVETIVTLGGFTGGIALSPTGELYICNPALGIVRLQSDRKHDVFASFFGSQKIICPNFPVFDTHGRLYVTDSGQWKKETGALLRFEPDGSGRAIAGPFGYANGLALSADEGVLFMAESDKDRIWKFALDDEGLVASSQIFAEGVGRLPDGLALDVEGNLYVCCYASDEVLIIHPDGSRRQLAFDHHAIMISRPTNLAFGGPGGDEIYVANLGRYTITRAPAGVKGQPLAHQMAHQRGV